MDHDHGVCLRLTQIKNTKMTWVVAKRTEVKKRKIHTLPGSWLGNSPTPKMSNYFFLDP